MKTIGLLCGVSWLSTKFYYEIINTATTRKLGGYNSAHVIMNSVSEHHVISLLNDGHFKEVEKFLIKSCRVLEDAGCDFLGITCNTLHYFFDAIQEKLSIPIIHIMDSVAKRLNTHNIKQVGILATGYTTKFRLYDKFLEPLNISSIYPDIFSVKTINDLIFKTVRSEPLTPRDQQLISQVCSHLEQQNVEAIILGCTELYLMINNYLNLPLFNSAAIHAEDLTHRAIDNLVENPNKKMELVEEIIF